MDFLRIGFEAEERGARVGAGLGGQEGDQDFAGLKVAAAREWAGGDGLPQFTGRAEDDVGSALEGVLDRTLNLLRQRN